MLKSPLKILKAAHQFEKMAQELMSDFNPGVPKHIERLYPDFVGLLGKDIPIQELISWERNNRTVLGTKLKDKAWDLEKDYLSTTIDTSRKGAVGAFILKTTDLPKDLQDDKYSTRKIIESSALRGSKNIPTLYLFIIKSTDIEEPGVSVPKELAHDVYLIKAFKHLFNLNEYNALKFYNDNKSKIDNVRRMFSVTNPEYLGGGADGVAFSIGPNRVLKIFRSHNAFEKSKDAVERLHKSPDLANTEAMMYDAGILGLFGGQPIYYYVIEKMITIESLDSDVQELAGDLLGHAEHQVNRINDLVYKSMEQKLKDPTKHKELKEEVSKISHDIANKIMQGYGKDTRALYDNISLTYTEDGQYVESKLKPDWLVKFIEEVLMKNLTDRTDLHIGNFGITQQGYLRFFDPVYE